MYFRVNLVIDGFPIEESTTNMLCMYVCACMYVCMYACMYVGMCMYVLYKSVCMYECMYVLRTRGLGAFGAAGPRAELPSCEFSCAHVSGWCLS
jgi:hypothetical protein